ncbi:MAG: topoisomerase DNA-binding C4 zinc finger domain-containing protein, partial [Erysipelotrichaceae bacterium]
YGPFVACSDYPTCKYIEKKEGSQPEAEPTGEDCPQCGKPLVKKTGRFGPFVGCSDYPKCKYIVNDRVKSKGVEEPTGEACPKCGKPLVKKTGRYGPFIACSDYPKCKYIQPKVKKNEK